MKSFGLTLGLKNDPNLIEQYKAYHRQVWPEILAGLREVGVTEMKIFLLGTRMFMYLETTDDFDLERDLPRASDFPKGYEWQRIMVGLQERAPEARPDQWWAGMELVCDLNWPQHRPGA